MSLDDVPAVQFVLLGIHIDTNKTPFSHLFLYYKRHPSSRTQARPLTLPDPQFNFFLACFPSLPNLFFPHFCHLSIFPLLKLSLFYKSPLVLLMLFKLFGLFLLFSYINAHLLQVLSVFRHGARYYLHDFYDAETETEFWGELTAVGMRNHETLGKMIRKDYIQELKFISSQYNSSEVEIYTTNLNRTFESGLSHMYGLYPLGTGEVMPKVDKEYHIPPFSKAEDSPESLFSLPQGHQTIPVVINASVLPLSCPLASQEMRKNQNLRLSTYKEMNMTYYPFMKRMASIFNFTVLNFTYMLNLYDTLLVDKYLGRPMPDTFTDEDYENIQHLTYWYSHFTLSFNLSKAFNTLIMKRVLQDFDDRIANIEKKPLKWTFLSAHDTNIYALNGDLNISSSDCIEQLYRKGKTDALNCFPGPQFAANLIFELHSEDLVNFQVKTRYNGDYVYLCEEKKTSCSYSEWKKRVKENIIIDYAREICYGPGKEANQGKEFKDMSDLL